MRMESGLAGIAQCLQVPVEMPVHRVIHPEPAGASLDSLGEVLDGVGKL